MDFYRRLINEDMHYVLSEASAGTTRALTRALKKKARRAVQAEIEQALIDLAHWDPEEPDEDLRDLWVDDEWWDWADWREREYDRLMAAAEDPEPRPQGLADFLADEIGCDSWD